MLHRYIFVEHFTNHFKSQSDVICVFSRDRNIMLNNTNFCYFLTCLLDCESSWIFHVSYTANVYRDLRGSHMFFLQYLWKRAVRITEKPYTPQRECMLWGNPVIFTDCRENPMITIGFPCNLYIYYRDSYSPFP